MIGSTCRRTIRLSHSPHLADAGGRGRATTRLRQRGAVAAVPHRLRTADVSQPRLGLLPASSTRASPTRSCARRTSDDPDRARAGLPFRAAAADDSRAPAEGDGHHVLAHSLAQPGGLRHLSRGGARCCDGLLGSSILGFHTQFHCNNFLDTVDRFLEARVDREHIHRVAAAARSRPCIPIRYRSSGRRSRWLTAKRCRRRAKPCACASNLPRGPQARRRHRAAGLHQGHRRALPCRRTPARNRSAVGGRVSRSCRSRRPRAPIVGEYRAYAERV